MCESFDRHGKMTKVGVLHGFMETRMSRRRLDRRCTARWERSVVITVAFLGDEGLKARLRDSAWRRVSPALPIFNSRLLTVPTRTWALTSGLEMGLGQMQARRGS
jgi:hypothetical protein